MPIMNAKYILLEKDIDYTDKFQSHKFEPFKQMLESIYLDVTNNSFQVIVDDKANMIEYRCAVKENGRICHISFWVDGTLAHCAKVLDVVHSKLLEGHHRRNYNIVTSFDGVSQYYCNKLYPKLSLFERKIREIVYNIMIKSFGASWYNLTLSDSLKDELKRQTGGMNESELIEKALYEMTIYQLEEYLFSPYSEVDVVSLLDTDLSPASLENKNREEIVELLNKCQPKSLWDRFFEGNIKIKDLRFTLKVVRCYRNRVAHNKYLYSNDYVKCNGILNKTILQLNSAIEDIEGMTFSRYHINVSLSVFAETINRYIREMMSIKPAMQAILNVVKTYESAIPKLYFSVPPFNAYIANIIKNINLNDLNNIFRAPSQFHR